jgi:DNA-binding XRE family transcriptional regulator
MVELTKNFIINEEGLINTKTTSLVHLFHSLRLSRGLTEEDLAKKLSVTTEYISKIEDGSYPASLKYCLACAQEFGANVNWIKIKFFHERVNSFEESLKRKLHLEDF